MNAAANFSSTWAQASADHRDVPCNLEAEQAVLGAILFTNEAFERVDELLQPDHFYEPFHRRLYDEMATSIRSGRLAEPVVLNDRLKSDPAFAELGGLRYLADLMNNAPPAAHAADYAQSVYDLAVRRDLVRIGGELAKTAHEDRASPVTDIIGRAEASLLAAQLSTRQTVSTGLGQAIDDVFAYLDAPPEEIRGALCGLTPLDKRLGPFLAGDLIVVGGRTGMGKSALAAVLGLNICCPGLDAVCAGEGSISQVAGVLEINGEMTVAQMSRRHLTDVAQRMFGAKAPSYSAIRKREITFDERRMLEAAAALVRQLPLRMVKRAGMTLAQVRSLVRRQTSAWAREGVPLGAVIIDHVGLLKPDNRTRDRYEAQTEISNGMKVLAEELECPIIALAQLNREVEKRDNKRPIQSDLRDSGSWEQDADVIIGVYRDAYYAQREPEPKKDLEWNSWDQRRRSRTVEAILLKVREGEGGTAELWGDMRTNAIRSVAPEYGDLL